MGYYRYPPPCRRRNHGAARRASPDVGAVGWLEPGGPIRTPRRGLAATASAPGRGCWPVPPHTAGCHGTSTSSSRLDRVGHWLPDAPHRPIGLLRAILAWHGHDNLDDRPAAADMAREAAELAAHRTRVATQLAERTRKPHKRARAAAPPSMVLGMRTRRAAAAAAAHRAVLRRTQAAAAEAARLDAAMCAAAKSPLLGSNPGKPRTFPEQLHRPGPRPLDLAPVHEHPGPSDPRGRGGGGGGGGEEGGGGGRGGFDRGGVGAGDIPTGMAELAGIDPASIKVWSQRATALRSGRPTISSWSMARRPLRRSWRPRRRPPAPPNPNSGLGGIDQQWRADTRAIRLDREAFQEARQVRRAASKAPFDRRQLADMAEKSRRRRSPAPTWSS